MVLFLVNKPKRGESPKERKMELNFGVNTVVRKFDFICHKCGEIVKANKPSMAFMKRNEIVLSSHIECDKKKAKLKFKKVRR